MKTAAFEDVAAGRRRSTTAGKIVMLLGVAILASVVCARASAAPLLTTALAMEAATETVKVCAAKGNRVVVSVVDPDGVIKVQVRGDGGPVHSLGFSLRKAFTVVSMGPMFGVDSSSGVINFINSKFPNGTGNVGAGATELLFIPGGVLLTSGQDVAGAIGVSAAPSSLDDEACARAGAAQIRDRLNRTE